MDVSLRTFIIVRSRDGRRILERIEKTHCFWCGGRDFVCSACSARAEEIRRGEP